MPGEATIRPCLIIGVVAGGDSARTERAVGDALQHRAVAVGNGVDIAQSIRVQVVVSLFPTIPVIYSSY